MSKPRGQSSAGQSTKEQKAVALINQGKLQDAETFYRELMSVGTSNHIVYRSLAALCAMQGKFDEPTAAPQPPIKPELVQDILAQISFGGLIDKITILQIKTQHLQGAALEDVKRELEVLESTLNDLQLNIDPTLIQPLKEVNQDLWKAEDDIRDHERQKSFSETFIRLARSVYEQNDRRSAIKKGINTTYGSGLVEEKIGQEY